MCFCCGCAGTKEGAAGSDQDESCYNNDNWRQRPAWERPKKIAPLFSKTVVFPDNKGKEQHTKDDNTEE